MNLRRVLVTITLASATLLSGCVVAPIGPYPPRVAVVPPPVYVTPGYPMPAPGYGWHPHPRYGYGWRHPHYGWHRGWR